MGWAVGIDTKADAEQQSGTRPARGIESYAPASGELLGEAPVVSAAEVRAAVFARTVGERHPGA